MSKQSERRKKRYAEDRNTGKECLPRTLAYVHGEGLIEGKVDLAEFRGSLLDFLVPQMQQR